MKKPSTERRLYSIRVTAKRTERGRRGCTPAGSSGYWNRGEQRLVIAAPEVFGVETNTDRRSLVRFLSKLRYLALEGTSRIKIDFRSTERMQMAGTLLLAAELSRINVLALPRTVTCNYPKDDVVAQVLQHVGIFEMLGQQRQPKITADTVKYWKINTSASAEGRRADEAMAGYKDRFSDLKQRALYRALTEAMTNCSQHAYPKDGAERVRNWWMFSQLKDGLLTVGLCDLGIGIPRSLRRDDAGLLGSIMATVRALNLAPSDANLIRGAMVVGATRTKERHRGKGLADMRAVLDGLKGKLQIHSARGYYNYEAETESESCINFKKNMAISGTLVLWQLPMSSRGST